MGNHALRAELGRVLKKYGFGRLYTCSKRRARRYLKPAQMRGMIEMIETVGPGFRTNEWGVNQVVKARPAPVLGKIYPGNRGFIKDRMAQVRYESGYRGCGCGSPGCFFWNPPPKTKVEIVEDLKASMENKEWGPSLMAKDYFRLLEQGIDILDEDGYLVPDWMEKTR